MCLRDINKGTTENIAFCLCVHSTEGQRGNDDKNPSENSSKLLKAFGLIISTEEASSLQLSVYTDNKQLKTCEKIATEFLLS